MKTYRVRWSGGFEQIREATDMRTLLTALGVGEGRSEPQSIKQVVKVK